MLGTGSSSSALKFELAASNCLPAHCRPNRPLFSRFSGLDPSPSWSARLSSLGLGTLEKCQSPLASRLARREAVIRVVVLSRGVDSAPGGCGGKTKSGEPSVAPVLCNRCALSGSCSGSIVRAAGCSMLTSKVGILLRWKRSMALYSSPDGLISAWDAWLLSSIPRTSRSAVSWGESEEGGLSKLPDLGHG